MVEIYKPPKMPIQHFTSTLFIYFKMLSNCPTIMIGDFNVNMLTKTFVSTILQTFMNQ